MGRVIFGVIAHRNDYPLLGIIGFRFSALFVFHNNAQQSLTWLLRQPGAQEINVARL